MSQTQRIASCAIAFHVVALLVAAVPDPARLKVVGDLRYPSGDAVSRVLTPAFDTFAQLMARIVPVINAAVTPIRAVTTPYIAAGVGNQKWDMFSNPSMTDEYVRLDVWVLSPGDSSGRLIRQVLLPADDEQRLRGAHVFRDKAIINSLENASMALAQLDRSVDIVGANRAQQEAQALRQLAPLARWGRRRLELTLTPRERIARVELWHGEAANPRPGERLSDNVIRSRLALIEQFHHAPAPVTEIPVQGRIIGAAEREGDLAWTLLYIETP